MLVKVYAPWYRNFLFRCGHCQALAPIWEELEKYYEHDDHIVIASLNIEEDDMIANVLKSRKLINGVPSILVKNFLFNSYIIMRIKISPKNMKERELWKNL